MDLCLKRRREEGSLALQFLLCVLLVTSPVDGVVNGCSWWCVLIIMAQHVCIVYLWLVYIAVLCGPPGVVAGTPRRCYTGCLSGCS